MSEAAGGVGFGAGDPAFNQSFVDERAIAQVEVRGGGGAVAGAGESNDDLDGLGDEMFVEPLLEGGGLIGERPDAGEADGGGLGLAGVGDEQLFISEDVGDGAAGGGGGEGGERDPAPVSGESCLHGDCREVVGLRRRR